MQVRCFVNDGEERWLMWYSGRARGQNGMDAIFNAAGSIGKPHARYTCTSAYFMGCPAGLCQGSK